MSEGEIFEIVRAHIWGAVLMSLPILLATLVIGVLIGLVQALTSVQEMTLSFIPKLIGVVVVFFLSMGYMTAICLDLFNDWVLPAIAR